MTKRRTTTRRQSRRRSRPLEITDLLGCCMWLAVQLAVICLLVLWMWTR